ncbi:MAG TPA: exodeoxyribonuclease VII large subunit, partial [Thermoflexales bacterium]|nr:exodeoxyribonuclease VII large subunit [Thermoflexales bacterium]
TRAMSGRIALDRAALAGARGKLEAYSPLATLARGYAIVSTELDKAVVRQVDQAGAGVALRIRVSDGEVSAVSRGAAT